MKLVSYTDLARIRFKDFLAEETETYIEESGMTICVGLGGMEQFGESFFGWRQGDLFQTAEVTLDLRENSILPKDIAEKILHKLQLPVKKAMSTAQLIEIFGNPERSYSGSAGSFLRFVCGEPEKYFIGCVVEVKNGLSSVFLARKDYCDENEAI